MVGRTRRVKRVQAASLVVNLKVWSRLMRVLCVLVVAALLCGCGKSSSEHLADARQAVSDAAYDDAIAAAEAGLQGSPNAATKWGLELVRLESYARSGLADQTAAHVEKLAGLYPDQMPPSQYAATAGQLKSAGEGPASIQVLDLAMKRYPGDPLIERLIGASKNSDAGSAELQMLRSLGYIE
jgi:hypothetical protein